MTKPFVLTCIFLRNLLVREGHQLKAKLLYLPRQPFENPLLILLLISFLTDIGVLVSKLQHAVDQYSEFVSGRNDAFRLS